MSPRTGRPKSENPKNIDIKIRIDEDTNVKLLEYAKENKITRVEAIRRGISKILSKK